MKMDINRLEYKYKFSKINQVFSNQKKNSYNSYFMGFLLKSIFDFPNNLLDRIKEIFKPGINIKEESEEDIDYNKLYYINNSNSNKENEEENQKETNNNKNDLSPENSNDLSKKNSFSIRKVIFKIETTNSTNNKKEFIHKKRKRGRKCKLNINKNELDIHNAFSEDNLIKKIRVHFLNFCIAFINFLISPYLENVNFLKLSNESKIINKDNKLSLKNKSLGEIVDNKINDKYKIYDKDTNKKIFAQFKNHELLREIFAINYEQLFKIYKNNIKIINLNEYILNKEIVKKYKLNQNFLLCSNVKLFTDLLENNTTYLDLLKDNKILLAQKYTNCLIHCANHNY